ncbi:glycosyltransferase family 4 protein [Candidatus Falkowbacteria bacterium]|nr:glycosyltransferase family 4 protein [Candidatus Falkowbacteria bacterium]
MKICYFGDYDSNYPRNLVLLKGFRENGAEILECHSDKKGLSLYWDLFWKHWKIRKKYDVLIVAQSFTSDLAWFAQRLSDKKVVWDAFYSFYDRDIFGDGSIVPRGFRQKARWRGERRSCRAADLILLDTDEDIKYFVKEYGISETKFKKVLVGADISGIVPLKKAGTDKFLICFHGNYTLLQGVRYVIGAAKILENHHQIRFCLIGQGQTFIDDRRLAYSYNLNNVEFVKELSRQELLDTMEGADVCLGIFGDTPRTQRVIPKKVFEAIALSKPIISANTPAMRELFTDRENILFCGIGNSEDLANKILELRNNKELREQIAASGYQLFQEKATPKVIAKDLLKHLSNLIVKK